jgi:hypothetical protein
MQGVHVKLNPELPWQKQHSTRRRLFHQQTGFKFMDETTKCYIWSTPLYGAETWTLRKVDQKYLESFEVWCWRRMEKISCTDRVRNEEVLHTVKEERNILYKIKRRKAEWIGHILCRNSLLKHVIQGNLQGRTEMMGRRGTRPKQLLDDLKENRRYWKLKEEALDHTL